MVVGSCPASTGSISTAVTLRAAVQQAKRQRTQPGADLQDVVMAVDTGRRHNPAHGVGIMNEVLAEGLARPKVEVFGQVPYLGPPEQSDRQDAPIPLHTGQAPQPCRARVTSAIAICSSLVARYALPAYPDRRSLPGVLIKLDAAVEAGARVDGPVTTGFAPRKGVLDPYVAHRRHLCPRLGAHPQHPVSGRRNNDIGYWQPAGFVVDMSSASAINDAAERTLPSCK